MVRHITTTIILSSITFLCYAQKTPLQSDSTVNIFEKVKESIETFQLDTSATPNDKITKKIIELRKLGGGFNISDALDYKIEEDRQKSEIPTEELDKLVTYFKSGKGKRWLDNATIWIYRKEFSYSELKKLVKFYKTSAGRKIAKNFPFLMMQSLKAAEMIKDIYIKQQDK